MPVSDFLARRILAARLAIGLERAARLAFRPLMGIGLAWLALLSGLPALLPDWPRLVFWGLAAALWLASLWPLRHWRWPGEREALSRLERDAGLSFHPLLALRDGLAGGNAELWQAHRQRMAAAVARLTVPVPRFDPGPQDPMALRHGLALLLIVFLVLGSPLPLRQSLPSLPGNGAALAVDGWITPPAYTGKPPILLAQGVARPATDLKVPAGSVLILRAPGAELAFGAERFAGDGEFRRELREDGELVLHSGWREIARWRWQVVPDGAPQISFDGPPRVSETGGLIVAWQAQDDYGITHVALRIKPVAAALGANAPVLEANTRQAKGRLSGDFTQHPWAGEKVEAHLEARDGAGHVSRSASQYFMLPERPFSNAYARALIEQRKQLLRDPGNLPVAVGLLDGLAVYPEMPLAASGHYLTLRAITRRLYHDPGAASVDAAIRDLWQLAVQLDGGSLGDAKAKFEAARKALEQALAEGAPQDRIDKLITDLRAAMQDYLQAMADAARRGEFAGEPPPGNSREISQADLQRLLDEMRKSASGGKNDEARDLLSALDSMLKSLRFSEGGAGGQGGGNGSLLREFGDMLRGQQKLMDRTWRLPETGGDGENAAIARDQKRLQRQLEALMDQMRDQGLDVPGKLGDATRGMGEAGKALTEPDRQKALRNQQQALKELRDSFDDLARSLTGDGQAGMQAGDGRTGRGTDPLGREYSGQTLDDGGNRDMVGEGGLGAARGALDELRRRSGKPGLSQMERDYYERLLRGLY